MRKQYSTLLPLGLCALLALDGCYWTKHTWNRITGRTPRVAQSQPSAPSGNEQPAPGTVTGAEGELGAAADSAPTPVAPAMTPITNASASDLPSASDAPNAVASTTAPASPSASRPSTEVSVAAAAEAAPAEIITLQSDAAFAFGRADLSAAGRAKLDAVAEKISAAGLGKSGNILVTGHADRIGTAAKNVALSKARAEAVRDHLVASGIAASAIRTAGAGSTAPVVNCPGTKVTPKLIECLAPNRRVEVTLGAK